MNERIKKVTTTVKEKWSGFSKTVKIVIVAIPITIIAIIVLLAILLNHKNYTVLYSGLTTAEAGEIASAIQEMGITDVRLSNNDIIVPSDQVDSLRMQLAIQGYPKNSINYNIWNDGVNLWATAEDKRVIARQQRETNIAATLGQLSSVYQATVLLDVPKTRDYTITDTKEVPKCSVTLKLNSDSELTNGEVRAIFALVSNSVEGLTYDNISVIDTYGRSYEWISKEQEEAEGRDASGVPIAQRRFAFERQMENALSQNLNSTLATVYGKNGYSINVSTRLNFNNKKIESTEYFPSPEGDNSGVLDHEKHEEQNAGVYGPDGLVGVTPNGDNSPDYPTIDGLIDGESYYYKYDEVQYDVTNIKTTIEGDGYEIDNISVGVWINTSEMTETDRERIQQTVAAAAGTAIENVSVMNTVFALSNANGGSTVTPGDGFGIITRPVDSFRNMLLFLVIALGIILIALLIVSLFMSRSRRKKIRHRQEMALAAAQAAADSGMAWGGEGEAPQEIDYNIASLTEEAGKESRETILKREIADFARNSPEIVASILRNMLREEGN